MIRSLRKWLAASVLAGVAVACNETPVGLPKAAQIVLSTTAITLAIGEFETVDAQVVDDNGDVMRSADLVWSSSDARIVQVDGRFGALEGIGAGAATVTVTHGSLTADIAVTVIGAATLEIIPQSIVVTSSVSFGLFTQEVTVRALGPNGEELALSFSSSTNVGNTVRWHSLDPSIASVGASGATETVSGRNVGSTFIVAEALGAADTVPVLVVAVIGAATLEIIPQSIVVTSSVSFGLFTQEVTVRALGPNGEELALSFSSSTNVGNTVRWHSLDPSIASVGASGATETVSGRNVGSTFIVAEALGAADTVPVLVVADETTIITRIDIIPDSAMIDVALPGTLPVRISLLEGDGDEVCQFSQTEIGLRFDVTVLSATFIGTCRINLGAVNAGGTWLYAEVNNAVDSIWVEVTQQLIAANSGFTATPDPATLIAGSAALYTVTLLDKDQQPVPGVTVHFDADGGIVSGPPPPPGFAAAQQALSVVTDANGAATATWNLPTIAANYFLEARADLPGGGMLDIGIVETILPDVAVRLIVLDITAGTDPDEVTLVPSGGTAQTGLGQPLDPTFLVQSVDQFGNELDETNVTYELADPSLIDNLFDPVCPGLCAGLKAPTSFELVPEALGTVTLTVTVIEGSASSVVNVDATLGPAGVFHFDDGGLGREVIVVGQPQYASDLSDTDTYNNVDAVNLAFPTLSADGSKVAFHIQTGNWNLAVVASAGADKDDAAALVELLTDPDYEASALAGFPAFRGASGNEVLFLSDRDPAKVLAGDQMWDLYSLDRASGVVTKITNTAASDNIRYFGLSLSPDESTVLVVSNDDHTPPERVSQVFEINVTTGVITQLTNSIEFQGTHFTGATYSPDGSIVYIGQDFDTGLLEKEGAVFRPIGVGANVQRYLSFDPTDPNVFATLEFGSIRFRDAGNPTEALELVGVGGTFGRTALFTFSWSKR